MGRFLRSVSTDTVDPRQYKNYQEYTSAGSYSFTVPAGVSRIRAIVVGAGGGGACSKTTYYGGNGGGGGGFAMGEYDVIPGQVLAITVGGSGSGSSSNNTKAGNGGSSSVGSLLSATGGQGADGRPYPAHPG